ncbi:MAG: RNA polymerase sigma factor [Actinomycetota bacterium]
MARRMEEAPLVMGLPPGSLEDKELTLAYQRGEDGAYQAIYDRYKPRVQSVCRRMLGNTQDAQDATQESFLKVYQALGRFNGRYQMGPWITRIATNVCLDHIRARSRRPQDTLPLELSEIEGLDELHADGPDEVVIRRSESRRVRKVLESLPPMHRAAIVLRDFEGLSYQEVAVALQITECQVKALIHRARQGFKRSWTSVALGVLLPTRLFQRGSKLQAAKNSGAQSSIGHVAEGLTASAGPAISSCSAALSHCGQFMADRFAPALTAMALGAASLALPAQGDEPRASQVERVVTETTQALDQAPISLRTGGDQTLGSVGSRGSSKGSPAEGVDDPAPAPAEEGAGEEPVTPTPEPPPSPGPTQPPPSPEPGSESESPELAPHPSGFSFSFAWDGTFVGHSCGCMTETSVASETAEVSSGIGIVGFEQRVVGTATAAGVDAFRVELDHRVSQSAYGGSFLLHTGEGSYGYDMHAQATSKARNDWGGWTHTYSGSYELMSSPSSGESVPRLGTYSVTVEGSPSRQRLPLVTISLVEST